MRTLIYRRWYEISEDVTKDTEGRDDVEDFYIRKDGFVEIRYTAESGRGTYYVPNSQILAYFFEDDE